MSVDRQATLLDRLRECDLLEAGPLEELGGLAEARDPDPRALGRVLLQRGLLSRFQINFVAQGRGKELPRYLACRRAILTAGCSVASAPP